MFMTSETAASLIPSQGERLKIFMHALLVVLGFSLVFVVGWGGSVTALGQLFGSYKYELGRIGGVVVIIFGLATIAILMSCRHQLDLTNVPLVHFGA
mgnify:CR=1 FL=1